VHCQIQQFREVIRDHNINRISFMSRHLESSIALFQDGCKSRKLCLGRTWSLKGRMPGSCAGVGGGRPPIIASNTRAVIG
jgi:hypothetical protein